MTTAFPMQLAALAALIPLAIVPLRPGAGRNGLFWGVLGLAVAASAVAVLPQMGEWNAGLGNTVRVGLAATLLVYAVLNLLDSQAWRLAPLLLPYLLVLGLLALIFRGDPMRSLAAPAPFAWLELHIIVSVLTYALLTVAAVAALAGFLQERALKTKRPTNLSRLLPPLAYSERLTAKLLVASEFVLGLGLASGVATLRAETGALLKLDHKILLSVLAFLLIAGLIAAQRLAGVRGRLATRLLLVAYLLLVLAYGGVKFVQQVLLV